MIDKKPEIITINGYKIYFFKSINKTFYIKANVKNGFFKENKSNCGINHLLEHILTNSWRKCLENKCDSYWKKKGVYYNAETSDTIISYYLFGLKEYNYEMTDYIIQTMTDPIINIQMIENEKNAVLNELLIYINNNKYELNKRFMEEFFTIEGLKYMVNYKEQIKNLNKININDLMVIFNKYYNNSNISFSLIGNYNKKDIIQCFKSHLKKNNGPETYYPKNIFTFNNKIVSVYSKNTLNYIIKISFPIITNIDIIYLNTTLKILNIIMFDRLRTQLKLIYGLTIHCPDYINKNVEINVEVDKNNVEELLQEIINILDFHNKNKISNAYLKSIILKNRLEYYKLYNNNDDIYIMEHYMNQYNRDYKKVYTIREEYKKVNNITPENIMYIMRKVFDFNKMFIIYQSRFKL